MIQTIIVFTMITATEEEDPTVMLVMTMGVLEITEEVMQAMIVWGQLVATGEEGPTVI